MKKPHHLAELDMKIEDGRGGYVIYPRGLNIVWGDDPRYWSLDKNNNRGPATLIQVSWLDISGTVPVTQGKYKVSFDVKLKPDAFGWTGSPVLVMAKVGKKGKYEYSEVTLSTSEEAFVKIPSNSQVIVEVPPRAAGDECKIYFGLYEVWSGKWKGGLQIEKANVEKIA